MNNPRPFSLSDIEFAPEILPNSVAAEFGLLGCILSQNSMLDDLGFLHANHFYDAHNAAIYGAMIDLHEIKEPITPFSLKSFFQFGFDVIQHLAAALSYSGAMFHPLKDARVIVEMSNRRALITLCRETAMQVKAETISAPEAIAEISLKIDAINSHGDLSKFQTDKTVSRTIIERLNAPSNPYRTGIRKLDTAMEGGLFPGFNYVFAARKKMGKTSLASTVSCNLNQQGIKHLFICAEMSAVEIHQRIVARIIHSPTSSFRNGQGKNAGFQKRIEDQIESSNGCIIYQSAPGLTFEGLKSSVAQAISLYGIKGFILDSLQLVGGKQPRKSTAEHQDEVAQWCADYGRQRGVWSIVMAQVNQTGGIRGGEGVRLACDQAYEIHAPEDDPSMSARWLEMIETRYTPWMNIGSKESPGLLMHEHGQYFFEPEIANASKTEDGFDFG